MATSKKSTGADLSDIGAPQDTAKVYLYHPISGDELEDSQGQKMYVEVYGQDSDRFREIDRAITNRNIQKAQKSRRAALTADQLESQRLERVSKCVKSWHLVVGGEQPECTEANARHLLETYDWLRDQVEEGMYDRANFLANSSAS